MRMSIVGNRVGVGVVLALSTAVLLMLVMNQSTPAIAQQTSTVRVSNLDQPSSVLRTTIGGEQKYAQTFCTGSVAVTLDKVRLYTLSNETDPNAMFYENDPAPVVTIRSTDAWGKPGAVLHTLTSPVIDDSMDTAEDFTSSGYELAANTTYSVVIHRPISTGHIGFLTTTSPHEDTEPQLGWTIGDQYMYYAGHGWTDDHHEGLVMKMAIYASGGIPSTSTPTFTDCGETRSSYQFSVDENSAEHTIVGVVAAGDADGDSITYSVSGADAAKFNNVFNLNTSTGEITVKSGASIDYESSDKSYSITVSVTDGEDASGAAESPPTTDATTSVSIEVINIDEPGTVTVSTTAPRVGGELTVNVTDPDDDTLLISRVQWYRAANADAPFIVIPIDPGYMANPSFTPTAADQSKYLKVTVFYVERSCGQVSSFDDRCRAEAEYTFDTLVANAEGLIVQSQRVNRPATGEPLIVGAPPPGYQWVGWLGLWVIRNTVQDPDGMNRGVSYQWLRVDPDTLAEENIQNATGWTYVPTRADLGKGIKVRASFVDNLGSRESRTSPPIWAPRPPNNAATGSPGITGAVQVGQTLSADTSGISDTDVIVASTLAYQWIVNDGTEDTDIQDATGATYTLDADDEGKTIKVKVSFTDEVSYEESLTSAPTATVASQESSFTATTHDVPESHDGATEFTFELRFNEEPGSGFSYAKLRNNNAFTVTGGSVSNVRRLEAGKNAQWEITVLPSGNAAVSVALPATTDCAAEGAICNMRNMKLSSALEFTVSGPGPSTQQQTVLQENSPARGDPTINGTVQVGETLTASTSGISDTDGLADATFTYQWLADDTDINGATTSSYTVVAADAGKTIKVRVSFTDDDGNEESVTSATTAAVTQPPMTATFHDEPSSHDGATAFTFELRFSESPAASFGFATVQNHAFTVTGGSVSNVRRLDPGKNVRWEITVTPSSDADVTLALNVTTDCSAEGAICTDDGVRLSGALELVVPGPPQNSAASGAPTISGTAQVGQTLIASTSGIADADGMANATFTYQWLADDVDISGGTGSSYTLVAADEGKVITVTVFFTDDEGNAESLTSAATTAVAKPPLTAAIHDKPSSHDGSTAFTFELRLSENIKNLSYTTLHEHALTVTGGTVDKARRLAAPSNVRWEITVTPASSSDVIIVLPITSDCTAQGAICTSDSRKLSNRVGLTISGPGG